jgi:hypothetical protein
VRVIARLTKERDEARDALSKVTVAPASVGAANGDAMAVDNEGLPDDLAEHTHELQQQYVSWDLNALTGDADALQINEGPQEATRSARLGQRR